MREWFDFDLARRWCQVVQSWFYASNCLGIGARLNGDVTEPALKYRLDEHAMELRLFLRECVLDGCPIAVPVAIAQWCEWRRPLLWRADYGTQEFFRREAENLSLIGVFHEGRLHPAARAVLERVTDPTFSPLTAIDDPTLFVVSEWLNRAESTVKVQGDMTIVVTGQPSATLTTELGVIADVVSRGAATVYRLTEASMHRAFDSGRSASDIIALLHEQAAAVVPPAVATMVHDAERRFGRFRVGKATSVVVVIDALAAAEVASSRNAKVRAVDLRQIAPTVFTSDAPFAKVLAALKEGGFAASLLGGSSGESSIAPSATKRAWDVPSGLYQFRRPPPPVDAASLAEALINPAKQMKLPGTPVSQTSDELPTVGDDVLVLYTVGGRKPKSVFGEVMAATTQVILLRDRGGSSIIIPVDSILDWAYGDDMFDEDDEF